MEAGEVNGGWRSGVVTRMSGSSGWVILGVRLGHTMTATPYE